jgi:hypothetical protein
VKAPGFNSRAKIKCEKLGSKFAFEFNLYRYIVSSVTTASLTGSSMYSAGGGGGSSKVGLDTTFRSRYFCSQNTVQLI